MSEKGEGVSTKREWASEKRKGRIAGKLDCVADFSFPFHGREINFVPLLETLATQESNNFILKLLCGTFPWSV